MEVSEIERLVASNPARLVVIDEAYVDFGAESAIPLTRRYDNLIVVGTFSKSRSLAGGRLGFAIANPALIADLETVRYSINPYNVNRMSMAAGVAALRDAVYYKANCRTIERTREDTAARLRALGFEVLPSKANFLFVRSDRCAGETLYLELKRRGVLVRHFTKPRIADYLRVTVGSVSEMEQFLKTTEEILNEER